MWLKRLTPSFFGLIVFVYTGICFGQVSEKPNIILILADDLGYGDLSCNGATKVSTPNIDKLAQEGVRFVNAYSPHSVCTPTRYALMTGRYAWRTWNGHQTIWSPDPMLIETARLTLPKILKTKGYHTALLGKWHLGFGAPGTPGWDDFKGPDYNMPLKPGPLEAGFDYFWGVPHVGLKPLVYIENHHVVGLGKDKKMEIKLDKRWDGTETTYFERLPPPTPNHDFMGEEDIRYAHPDLGIAVTDKAVDWIEKQEAKKPFFLYVGHRNVHGPLAPNQRFKGTSPIGVYGDFINELDWSVGEILKALDRKGLTKNTIVVFASDNGGVRYPQVTRNVDFNGHNPNGPFSGQKTEAYEGGVHIPLLVRWPGVAKPNTVSDKLVALIDMLATVAEMHKISLPWNAGEDSFSFLHELKGIKPVQPVREDLVVDGKSGMFAIRQGPWKFISGQGGGGYDWDEKKYIRMGPHSWDYKFEPGNPPGQLYNLETDPGENNNLYESNRAVVTRLRAKLREIQYNGRSR